MGVSAFRRRLTRTTILAATGTLGRALLARLVSQGSRPIAVGRDPAKLALLADIAEIRCADFDDPLALSIAMADADTVVCCGNAVHLPAILAALPKAGVARLVVMGSTRCFSAIPDGTADAVRRARTLLETLAIPHALLLSSMIYGTDTSVVAGLARLAARSPILPVPSGTRVQPIHIDDVVLSLEAALTAPAARGKPIVIAGPVALSYVQMARAIVTAHRLRTIVLPVPRQLLAVAGAALRRPSLSRLAEDAAFDVSDMHSRLGVISREFAP